MILLRLFLLFTTVPILELYILLKLGEAYGAGVTLLVVIGTGFIGAYLARSEGSRAWQRIQQELVMGRFPGSEIIDGFLILIAGNARIWCVPQAIPLNEVVNNQTLEFCLKVKLVERNIHEVAGVL